MTKKSSQGCGKATAKSCSQCRCKCICEICSKLSAKIGLNAFSLLAEDNHQLENFHSKVIAALLDPRRKSGIGWHGLAVFVRLLQCASKNKEQRMLLEDFVKCLERKDCDVEVTTEKETDDNRGRIDIYVGLKKKNGETRAIIIENKINGAPDMERQLVRYCDDVEGRAKHKVVAIVYLKPYSNSETEFPGWSVADRLKVSKVLICLSACKDEDPLSLSVGWLNELLKKVTNSVARSTIEQYGEFIAGQTKRSEKWNKLLKLVSRQFQTADNAAEACAGNADAVAVIQKLNGYVEGRLLAACEKSGFKDAVWWKKQRAAFHGLWLDREEKKVEIALDVVVATGEIKLFVRTDKVKGIRKRFKDICEIAKEIDARFSNGNGRSDYRIKIEQHEIYADVDRFILRVSKILVGISERKDEISRLLGI